jgi:hypothetical protein
VVDVSEVEKAAMGGSSSSSSKMGGGGAGDGPVDVGAASMVAAKTLEDFVYPKQDDTSPSSSLRVGNGGGGEGEGGGGGGDKVCGVTASDKNLVVSLESGAVHRYSLPHVSLEQVYTWCLVLGSPSTWRRDDHHCWR